MIDCWWQWTSPHCLWKASSQWKFYQRGFGWVGWTLNENDVMPGIQVLGESARQQAWRMEEASQWKICEKGSGWAWVTPTWEARIKTSDLSSEAKGPLAWFTLVKPWWQWGCSEKSMEALSEVGMFEVLKEPEIEWCEVCKP